LDAALTEIAAAYAVASAQVMPLGSLTLKIVSFPAQVGRGE
jgi:hypothetical protein